MCIFMSILLLVVKCWSQFVAMVCIPGPWKGCRWFCCSTELHPNMRSFPPGTTAPSALCETSPFCHVPQSVCWWFSCCESAVCLIALFCLRWENTPNVRLNGSSSRNSRTECKTECTPWCKTKLGAHGSLETVWEKVKEVVNWNCFVSRL